MSFLDQLKSGQNKLNSVPKPETSEIQIDLCPDSETYLNLMRETYIEEYYSAIEPFTFKSVFFPLAVPDAEAIREAYEKCKNEKEYDWRVDDRLLEIAKKIDLSVAELGTEDIFVRFSSRSPKDAVLNFKGKQILIDQYNRLKKEYEDLGIEIDSDSLLLHALYILGTEGMRLQNGEQAIDLFIGSERVQGDLDDWIQNPNIDFNMMVREFASFEVELEFRGFVYDNKLTAITQYNEFCYFPRLASHHEEITELMVGFTAELNESISLANYVLDFILISKTPEQGMYTNLQVWVVEINPLAEFAGAGLFKWEVKSDKATLLGKNPFEFRYVKSAIPNAIQNVGTEWRAFAQSTINQL